MQLTSLGPSHLPAKVAGDPDGFSFGGLLSVDRAGSLWVSTKAGRWVKFGTEETIAPLALPNGDWSHGGALIDGPDVIRSAYIYYDANNTQRVGHHDGQQWRSVWDEKKQGYVAGYMCWVPERWRADLGDFLTGQSGIPIISRTSYGPAVFGASATPSATSVTKPLIYYPPEHQTLGAYEGQGELFNETMQIKGVAIIDDAIVFGGTIGIGPRCYGNGTSDQSKHDTQVGGEHFCYDPEFADKGNHAYPYRYQLWRYPIADVIAATNPWDLIPEIIVLDQWPGRTKLAGMAYDERTRTLYFSQHAAENNDRVGGYPVIHSYRVEPVSAPTPVPVPVPMPVPVPSSDRQRIEALEQVIAKLRTALQ